METFLFLFEMLGTIAFAASGAVLGVRKGLDVFGVCILGLTTACGGGVCHPVSVGPLPVESAPSQRLKKRRNFPDMAWISCENRQDAPLDNPKEPCYHDSILKKGLEKDAVREELQRDAVMG